jgi:hypothetical protein
MNLKGFSEKNNDDELKNKINISVILLAHDEPDKKFLNCINCLTTQNFENYEIILIWSKKHKNLNISDMLSEKEIDQSKIKIRSFKKNLGYALGNNIGVNLARGKFTLIINPDVIVDSNFLKKMQKSFNFIQNKKRSDKIIVGPRINSSYGKNDFSKLYINFLGYSTNDSSKSDNIRRSVMFSGCAFMMKRKYFIQLGGFNSSYFMYHEDTELSTKASRMGFKIYIDNSINLLHLKSNEEYKMTKFKYYWWNRNRIRFTLENSSNRKKMIICQLLLEPFMLFYSILKGFLPEQFKLYKYFIENYKFLPKKKNEEMDLFEKYYLMEGINNELNNNRLIYQILSMLVKSFYFLYHH